MKVEHEELSDLFFLAEKRNKKSSAKQFASFRYDSKWKKNVSKQETFGKIPFRICCFSRADGSSTKSQCKQVTQQITELIDKIRIGT